MTSRSGKKKCWQMANDNEWWVEAATLRNIDKVYNFLETKGGSHTITKISQGTGVNPASVRFCVWLMAFKENPYFRVRATRFTTKNGGVKTAHKIKLIRVLIDDSQR